MYDCFLKHNSSSTLAAPVVTVVREGDANKKVKQENFK